VRKPKGQAGVNAPEPVIIGLRDRALIGVMTFTFARIRAVLKMQVRDYFVQGRRKWVRFHEKGGRELEVPCHPNLERYLDEYIAAANLVGDPDGLLFRTTGRKTGHAHALWQQDVYRLIQRHARNAGIATKIGNHTFRATGITVYLKGGGRLEVAQKMAGHASAQTTELYDRRHDAVSHEEVERIRI